MNKVILLLVAAPLITAALRAQNPTTNKIDGQFTTTTYTPNLYLEGGYLRADLLNIPGFPHDDVITIGQTTPITSTAVQANGIAVFQNILSSGGTNNVPFYSQVNAGSNSNTIWGANFNLQDTDVASRGGRTHKDITMFGLEVDTNVTSTTTAGCNLCSAGSFTVEPLNLGAYHIGASHEGSGHWTYGINVDDNAVLGVTMQFGSQTLAASSSSQIEAWRWRDGAANAHALNTYVDGTGKFRISDAAFAEADAYIQNGVLLVGSKPSTIPYQVGVPLGSIVLASGGGIYSPISSNKLDIQLIGLNSSNGIDIDLQGQGVTTHSVLNAVDGFQSNGAAGLSTTVSLPGCTLTFSGGILTAKSGGC
jgi:hypothetical protein